jgi:YidC/Oxa1 family membrane protein insertase
VKTTVGQDNKRLLLAVAISAVIMVGWSFLFPNKPPPKPVAAHSSADGGPALAVEPPQSAGLALGALPPPPAPDAPEETWVLESDLVKATLSSWGGSVKSLTMKGEKFKKGSAHFATAVDLVQVGEGEAWAFAMSPSPELGGTGEVARDPALKAPMRLAEKDANHVVFEGKLGDVDVKKTFTIGKKPFELALEVVLGGAKKAGTVAVIAPTYNAPLAEKPGFFSTAPPPVFSVPLCRAGDKTQRFDGKATVAVQPGETAWVGVDQHYFVTVVMPEPSGGECIFAKGSREGTSLAALRMPVPEGGAAHFALTVYTGPKQVEYLSAYGRSVETAIDYGVVTNLFAFFARALLEVMRFFHRFASNWGLAIILLTLLVKALLYPLTRKQLQSMQEMKKLQPEVDKLKVKWGADKQKLNQEMMQLYQKHKVNPLGGCLPLLLQMPVWLALYATLQTAVELYREPFLWIQDLTGPDPVFVLPLLMGASSFIMQRLSPQPADNAQAKMMLYFMPIFFTFLMLKLPAGLTLYIFVNNLLSIVQTQYVQRRMAVPTPAKA